MDFILSLFLLFSPVIFTVIFIYLIFLVVVVLSLLSRREYPKSFKTGDEAN